MQIMAHNLNTGSRMLAIAGPSSGKMARHFVIYDILYDI
jgi:hypothetical protein